MSGLVPLVVELERRLLEGRNPDGGWGYYQGKASRLEPTSWAVLALRSAKGVDAASALARWPVADGLLLERAGGQPNFGFHGIALLALHLTNREHSVTNARLLTAIQQARGIALKPSATMKQDNTLAAWSWVPGTFSWVEPTAWCLLALKKARDRGAVAIDAERIDTAERLLLDRACDGGGWNYGNSNVLGQRLPPYVPTTAVALMSLRDRRTDPIVEQGYEYLRRNSLVEPSGLALALVLCTLMAYGADTSPVRGALEDQIATTLAIGNHLAIALSLLAMCLEPRDAVALF